MISGFDKLVNMLDEHFDSRTVVTCIFLNVIVACSIYIVRGELYLGCLIHLLGMVEWDNLISPPMHYIDWTINVRHPIDIGELIKGKSPS